VRGVEGLIRSQCGVGLSFVARGGLGDGCDFEGLTLITML